MSHAKVWELLAAWRPIGWVDHACRECLPHGEIVRDGFQCAYHWAKASAVAGELALDADEVQYALHRVDSFNPGVQIGTYAKEATILAQVLRSCRRELAASKLVIDALEAQIRHERQEGLEAVREASAITAQSAEPEYCKDKDCVFFGWHKLMHPGGRLCE